MEPEDLPWPGELEEEEEAAAAAEEEAGNLDQDEVSVVEEAEEEEGRELDADYESQPRESTDDEDDEEAKAWLQARPGATFPPPPLPKHRYLEGERTWPEKVVPLISHVWQQPLYQDDSGTQISDTNVVSLGSGDDQRTESWHCLPQEMASSHTLDTTQTRFNVEEEGTEVTDFPSLEEVILTQSGNQVKEPNRDFLCSPLLVIQDSFASPYLPLLTCLAQDQEFGPDSLFHQSELDFAPLRGIPGKSEDTEWFFRPSEVSEALFQATSEVASDLVSSFFSISQHPLLGSTAVESQHTFLPPEQGTKEETISSVTVDELKTPKDSDSYDALCSYMPWKTQQVVQEPETNLADKGQVSFSTSSDTTDEYITPKGSDSFEASCSYIQHWKQEVLQQSEKYLTSKDHDSYSDSSDTIDKNKIPKGSGSFGAPFSGMLWSKQGASHHPETCLISKDCVFFPCEVAPHFNNKISYSFLRCSLERRGKGIPLMSDSHYFESVYLRASAENEVKQKMDSLEGCERNEGLGKELSQCFELKENRNTLVFSEVRPRSSEIQCVENVIVLDNSVTISEAHILSRGHDTSQMEASGGPLQTTKSNLDETSQQLYFQEERNRKAASAFGGKNLDATKNIAFEAVIASIEPSKKESTVSEIRTAINKSLTNDREESEPKNADLSLLSYNDENSFFDKLSPPCCQSPPGVFEPAASKPLFYKKDDDGSSLYRHPNLKSLPNVSQEMFIKPLSLIPELKSSASLSEKSHSQAVGLCKTQSALFQCDIDNEPFLPNGKIKSVSALDLLEKVGSSNIIYPTKVSTSDSWVLQDLKQQTFEEVADSSNYILEGLQGKAESDICTLDDDTECCSLDENAVVCSERVAELEREICDQGDLTGERIELAGLENLFDDLEICDSSLHWQSTLQLPSEEESNFEEPVGHSNVDINQSFSSVLPPFVPHEPARELEYHSSDLRMLRVSPDTVPKTLKHLAGDTSKGGIAEITQSNLKPGITTTPGDSDIGSHLSLSPEDLPQLAVRSPQENTVGQHTDSFNRQALADSHLTEETLKVLAVSELANQKTEISTVPSSSYSQRGKPNVFYPQALPDGHLPEEALKVSAVPGPADQKTGISAVPPSSYSLEEKSGVFYQQVLPDSRQPEEALKVSAVSGSADQKTKKTTVASSSYSDREENVVFSQQRLPGSSVTEQALKVSVVPGPADQKSRITTIPSSFYSLEEKPGIFYQQALPDSHLSEQAQKLSASPGPAEQKPGTPTVTSTPYLHGEKPHIFYQQTLPDSLLTEQAQKVSAVPGFAEQKPGTPTVTSTSYSHREKPSIYQQELPDSHLTEQAQKVSFVPGFAEQKPGTPTVTSTPYLHGEKPHIFYQQTLPDSLLTEQAQKVSAVPGFAEQKPGTPTVTSTLYLHREKPSIYQQELPNSHLTEQAQKVSFVPGFAEQKPGTPTVTSTPYLHGEKPHIFYQQTLPDSHLTEQAQKVSAIPGRTDQNTGIQTAPSSSYSHLEAPIIFYKQELPDSHLTEKVQKVSAFPGPADQNTGIPTGSSRSYSFGEKPNILYQQKLPDSLLTEQAQKVSAVPGDAEQKTGTPTLTSTPYLHGEKPHIFYQQTAPDSRLTEQAQKVSTFPGFAEQKTGIPTVASPSYPHGEKPHIFYQQTLPDSHLTEQAQKVSAVPGFAEQKTLIPTGSSRAYSFGEKPHILYHQALPDSLLTEEALKVSSVPRASDQKTGVVIVPSSSYSPREKPSIFYQQALPGSYLPEEALKVSVAPGPTEKKSGLPSEASSFYSQREKSNIFYQQELPDSHLTEQVQKLSSVSGPADQRTGIPTVTSPSYSHREKPFIFYPQGLPDSHLPEEALKVTAVSRPADQKPGIPTVPSPSYSHREKHVFFSPQALPDSHFLEEALKISAVSGPPDQKTGLPSELSSSYSNIGKPIIFYPQDLTDSHIPEEALKVSAVPGPADQKTRLPSELSSSYSHREKSSIFYQQEPDSHLTEEALTVSAVPGPADQKTRLPSEPSSSYSHREKSSIFYQQEPDSHLTEEALTVSAVLGPADQKTRLPSEPSSSYSHREKSSIFYQQEPDSHLTEEALTVSAVPGPADQKTRLPSEPSSSYSHREKSSIFYQQEPDSHLTEEALTVSAVPGPADQKTRLPSEPSSSYSHREKSSIFYQQEPDSHLTKEALTVSGVPGQADQKTEIPTVPSSSYSYREKPVIFYQERSLSDLTEEALQILGVPGPAEQKTGISAVTSAASSHGEKPIISYQQESPDITEETLKASAVSGPADQKVGKRIIPSSSYSYRDKASIFNEQELPDPTEEALKVFAFPAPADQKTEIPIGPSSSSSHKEKLKISAVILPHDQKTELPIAPPSSHSQRKKPKNSTVIEPDDQKTPLLTVFHNFYSQRVKPSIFFKQQLPDKHQSGDILKISAVPEQTDVNSGIPVPLSSSYSYKENTNILYPQDLSDKHLTEDTLKVSTIPGPADQKTVLPTAPPSSFSHRQKPDIFYQQDLPDTHLTEDALKISSGLGQAGQSTGLSTVPPGTYSRSEKHKLVSDHIQRLIDNLDSSNSSIISNNMPLNSQADGRVIINKPESSGFEDVGSEEIRDTDSGAKTLKEIRELLMEAENIALKRCSFPAPLVPFRDVSDISFIQSKKVVCFKEPPTTDESNDGLRRRQPFTEESPSNKCIQKDISTQTNMKCERGIENWEFISSTTVGSPLQEAESKAKAALDETLRQYKAAKSVMRSEPEGCGRTTGNKIVIPMMTIIRSDSSSDASSCSWDSNSVESVSDVLLNFFPYASPKTSMTDSREEEGVSESDDGCGSSVDSLAAHVKNLLKCESSLNHAKEILRNAEEEECRVRARAWNLKFNLARECGYPISELNEDDRRKVEEIKAKLFGPGRTTDLCKGLRSPRGIGCQPEAVCSHIIIESHEKGCFRTLTAEQPQLDSRPCVFRSADTSEMIRGQQSPSSWRTRHINLSRSLDQNNPHFEVWNSLQLQSHSPFQNFTADDFKISKGLRMPFRERMNPWLSELVEPACVPPEEMDCHSSHMVPPEPMKKFTTSITFSSHQHSKCFSDSSVLKVGVTEGNQCTGASVGVFNSHFTEEQNPPRDLKQKTYSPSSFKTISHSPDKAVTILAESSRQSQKLPVEHPHQEEKLLERYFKGSLSEPSTSANCSNFKEVHFSDNHTLISMGRPSSTLGAKQKTVTRTPDLPSHIFLEQRELFDQSKVSHADHHVRKHHSPPLQHKDYVVSNLPCRIFLEKQELFEQSKSPHVDHQMRENHSPLPQGQDYIASDLPSSIFLEQRQLFEQSKVSDVDHHMRKHDSPLPQGQNCVVEKNNQPKPKSHISNINVEAKFNNVVSQSAPNQCTLVTSASTPPSNRKALSCVRITLCPKTPSKLDSGTLDKRFHSLDPASKTRMNSEFKSDLQTISSRSLEPTSTLLTSNPVAQDQESLGFLGPKSSLDFQVVQSLLDSSTVTQDLKIMPFQNSQIVTSRQTQVNISDLEGYSNPEGTPISTDRPSEEIKTPFSAFSGKFSSDAVTQITTESPEKAIFSSEIFINPEDYGHEIPHPSAQKLGKVPVKFASSSSVQQITVPHGTDAQPSLLPYKPSGSPKMYYVPQLRQIPPFLDSTSDTTVESSHSGSSDTIISDAKVQVSISGDENLSDKNQMKEMYSKTAVTEAAQPEEKEPLQKDTAGSSDATAAERSAQLQDTKIESLPDAQATEQKEEIHSKSELPKEAWAEDKKSLQIDIAESRCHSEFENTTHSVFRSAKFYFHHPVHPPSDQDFCHDSLGRSIFMKHSWKNFFQHHPDKQREYICLPPHHQNVEKTKMDYTKIESLSINVNLENKEAMHTSKSEAKEYPKFDKQINDPKRDHKVTAELTTQHTVSLNELWNKYQERQRQQKPPEFTGKKELSLVERLDRLAKLLQNPITHSLRPSESTQDDSRVERDVKEWSGTQQQQKNKLQKKKWYKSLEKCNKNTGDLKKGKVLSTHQARRSNQIKIEQIKFDKYILRQQPGFYYVNNTSSDSRVSEESEMLTESATNILSTTTSPAESDTLTQTDKEVTLHDRSSSISTIDTARLIKAFGHERVCLSPRRIKLYSSITDHQRRYLEKRSRKNKKVLDTCRPQITSEHTRRKHIQVANHMISSDSISSSTSSFWSSTSTLCNKQNVHMLNKGIQAGNLEIVNGVRKHTRDVGMTFPTPSSTEAREEDSDVTSWSEENIEEKRLLTNYLGDKRLRKNEQSCREGVSWFVPVENVKSCPKKENLPKLRGPGISWFAPITSTKPWREPLREQNWQGQHMDNHGSLAGSGRDPLRPFVRATLQESLHLHRPDFISRSRERIKRLKLIVQERKLQNMLQSEREALFNAVRERQGYRDPMCPLPKRGFMAAQKNRPIGKKEMIQRSKRIYEQLPEVQKKREEEKRRLEYKSYRLRAQLFKKKVANQLLGRKVPWD
ncbi:centrosome-associated protein ALMS1 isoform X2 [Equus przewalskii]|uniref:Centrosome-associated protein ALMS1 isoform X2 n=1 Tax=Equus przewalskii TaxID=9798 RepID=A0ABM4KJX4_EQUPR